MLGNYQVRPWARLYIDDPGSQRGGLLKGFDMPVAGVDVSQA
jgi:hypothetical protein